MLRLAPPPVVVLDLPVCFPERACVDETPGGAHLIAATSALTPLSPAIAAVCFAAIGAAVVLIGSGLRRQWRGADVDPSIAVLSGALVVAGVATAWGVGGRLGAVAAIYAGADGRPSAVPPASLIGEWPLVEGAGITALAVGALSLFLMLNTAAVKERRARAAAGDAEVERS